MSVDTQVLSVSTVAAGGGAASAELANTGNPLIIGAAVGVAMIVILGFLTRLSINRD